MSTTGNVFPGTAENNAGIGATAWTNPSNATSDNAVDATCNAGASSQYLVLRNFVSGLPPSTINGITVRVECSEHSPGSEILNARLQDQTGTLIGSTKTATVNGTGKTVYTYGGVADLWGTTGLTEAIVNDADFGVRLWFTTSHDVRIDYVTMALEYTETPVSGGGGGVFPDPIFPGGVFPGPVFPGGGTGSGDVTVAISGVSAGASGQVIMYGPFPGDVFPGGVFPGPIFPGAGGVIVVSDNGGAGIVTPNFFLGLTSDLATTTVGFVTPPDNFVGVLTGVIATVTAGTVVASIDGTRALTGVIATSTLGSFGKIHSNALTGIGVAQSSWGLSWGISWGSSWGTSSSNTGTLPTVSVGTVVYTTSAAAVLTGVISTVTTGQVTAERFIGLTGVNATASVWFVTAGSDVVAVLTGVSATATAGSVIAPLAGNQATVSVGTAIATSTVALSGVLATANRGTVVRSQDRALTGNQIAVTVGTVIQTGSAVLNSVTATASVGTVGVIPSLNWVSVLTQTGTVVAGISQALTSATATTTAGSVSQSLEVALTSVLVGVIAGNTTVGTDKAADLTSVIATVTVGSMVPSWSFGLTTVVSTTTVGSFASVASDKALTGVDATVTAGTLVADANRTAAMTGVALNVVAGAVLAAGDSAAFPTSVTATTQTGTIGVATFKGLTGVSAATTAGTISVSQDKIVAITGVVATAQVGTLVRPPVPLTGVSVATQTDVFVIERFIRITSVIGTCRVGHTPKEGDVIVDTVGLSVAVGSVGTVGVGPQLPTSSYRHSVPAPIARLATRDLVDLEREFELVED